MSSASFLRGKSHPGTRYQGAHGEVVLLIDTLTTYHRHPHHQQSLLRAKSALPLSRTSIPPSHATVIYSHVRGGEVNGGGAAGRCQA